MKILKTKDNKNGSVQVFYSLTKEEELIFKSVARKQHKRFNKFFIRREVVKALKRNERENNICGDDNGRSKYWRKANETAREVNQWPEWKRSISSASDSGSTVIRGKS